MARPAEKARAMLNKWVAMRDRGNDTAAIRRAQVRRRPHLASQCDRLSDALRFRKQLLREIMQGVSKIQNPGLGEAAIRELNDEINHKMREKYHWNKRIKELGGEDFNQIEKERQIEEGDVQMANGYRYFGAAKDLPGVKELLEREATKKRKAKPTDHRINPDYFGWRDEEDGVLLEIEALATKQNDKQVKRPRLDLDGKSISSSDAVHEYLNTPSCEEVEKVLLEHKKKLLLAKLSL